MVKTRIEIFPDIKEHIDFFEAVPEYDIAMYTHKKMKTTAETSLEVFERCASIDWRLRKITAMTHCMQCSAVMWKKMDVRMVMLCGRSVPHFPENR